MPSIPRGALWFVLVLALAPMIALEPEAADAAEILTRPATMRIGEPTALSLGGVDAAAEYSAYADLRGRPCVRDQSAWQIGVVDPGRVAVFFGSDGRFVPSARVIRLCAYTLLRPEDGSTPVRTYLTERLSTLPFTLPAGRTPLPLVDNRGDALAPGWTKNAAGFTRFTFSCQRKRFTLTRRIPIGADWSFGASGPARADNSTNYDVPIPPRYAGHASLGVQGALSSVSPGVLRLAVRISFRAPGLRRTPGLPACRQGVRTFSATFRV
ncbi:MAG TPA: hypothetical protein VII98_12920 [Solirubrobacteraceae bacterium]